MFKRFLSLILTYLLIFGNVHAVIKSPTEPIDIFYVEDYLACDGTTDDTAALRNLVNTLAGNDNAKFIWRPGVTCAFTTAAPTVTIPSPTNLIFEFNGATILQIGGADPQFIATSGTGTFLTFRNGRFDGNAKTSFGAALNLGGQLNKVLIEGNEFFDSAPVAANGNDRYAILLASSATPHNDIAIINNIVDENTIEVDNTVRGIIQGNIVRNALDTTAIGVFGLTDARTHTDLLIDNNIIITPESSNGITVRIDDGADSTNTFERIRITNNLIYMGTDTTQAIFIGTPSSGTASTGNVFRNIIVENNTVLYDDATVTANPIIFNSSTTAAFECVDCSFSYNKIVALGRAGYAIDIRECNGCKVVGNDIRGGSHGINLDGSIDTLVADNLATDITTRAYQIGNSGGTNTLTGNRILGAAPTLPISIIAPHATDRFETIRGCVQAVICTGGAMTLTPWCSIVEIDNDTAGNCAVTMSEANVGTGMSFMAMTKDGGASSTVNYADTAGVSELSAAHNTDDTDSICMAYLNSAWHQTCFNNN